MRSLFVQIVGSFLFFFVADIVACVHIRTLVEDRLVMAAFTGFFLQVLHHWPAAWFADGKSKERWSLTVASGLGVAAGTALVIHMRW